MSSDDLEKITVKIPPGQARAIEQLVEEAERYRYKSDVVREGIEAVLRHHGKRQIVRVKPDREVRA